MADKYKLKPGEKATVTIELPEPPPAKPRRGYLGEDEIFYPSRRLDSRKFLNVYDFYRYADDSDVTEYYDAPLITFIYDPSDTSFALHSTGTVQMGVGDPAIETSWNAFVFADDKDDWPDIYKNITSELEDYYLSADNAGDLTGRGLVIPEEVVSIRGSGSTALDWNAEAGFFPHWLNGSGTIKTTSLPSFAASSVTLTIDKSIDIFLTPNFFNSGAAAQSDLDADALIPHLPQTWYYGRQQLLPLRRSIFLNNATYDAIWAVFDGGGDDDDLSQPQVDFLTAQFINNGLMSTYTLIPDDANYPGPIGGAWELSGGEIVSGSGGFPSADVLGHVHTTKTVGTNVLDGPGMLMAAVRKHTSPKEWYYIWATNVNANSGPLLLGGLLDK